MLSPEFWLVISLLWFVVAILTAKDARKRGMNQLFWLLVAIIFGIFGVVIYLLVRKPHPDRRTTSDSNRDEFTTKSWDEIDDEPASMSSTSEKE